MLAMKSFYSLSQTQLQNAIFPLSQSPRATELILNCVYRKSVHELWKLPELGKKVKHYLRENLRFDLPQIAHIHKSQDGTLKFLISFSDGKTVESVAMRFHKKISLCLSSQVGCAMKCSFCHTGTQGLSRHLSSHEIVGQYMAIKEWFSCHEADAPAITHLVFMGQGEPLHNFDELKNAIEILTNTYGPSLGRRAITVSTSGYLPGLQRFNELGGVNLALSLHSAIDAKRNQLIPIGRTYPIEKLFEAIEKIQLKKRQLIEVEYLLIKHVNCSEEDALKLCELLKNKNVMVNLIPFNEFPTTAYKRPSESEIDHFIKILVANNVRTMRRKTKGDDVLAACGQLISKTL